MSTQNIKGKSTIEYFDSKVDRFIKTIFTKPAVILSRQDLRISRQVIRLGTNHEFEFLQFGMLLLGDGVIPTVWFTNNANGFNVRF